MMSIQATSHVTFVITAGTLSVPTHSSMVMNYNSSRSLRLKIYIFLLLLPFENVAEKFNIFNSQSEDFVFAQLLLGWVSWYKFPQFGEGATHVLLAPAFTAVTERFARKDNQGPATARRRSISSFRCNNTLRCATTSSWWCPQCFIRCSETLTKTQPRGRRRWWTLRFSVFLFPLFVTWTTGRRRRFLLDWHFLSLKVKSNNFNLKTI